MLPPQDYYELAAQNNENVYFSFYLGFPLPSDYAILSDDGKQHAVVILSRSVRVTMIDPCSLPPFKKTSARFDTVTLKSASLDEAMGLCEP